MHNLSEPAIKLAQTSWFIIRNRFGGKATLQIDNNGGMPVATIFPSRGQVIETHATPSGETLIYMHPANELF